MTKLTTDELRAMSEHYKFDEASINDMALTIGVEKTKAICDFVRSPVRSTVQRPQAPIPINRSVPGPNRDIPQVTNQAIKQETRRIAIADLLNDTGTTKDHPKP